MNFLLGVDDLMIHKKTGFILNNISFNTQKVVSIYFYVREENLISAISN